MLLEIVAAGSVALAGTIGVVLWVDGRCPLEGAAVRTLFGLVFATTAMAGLALRLTAFEFPLSSVAAASVGLGLLDDRGRADDAPPAGDPPAPGWGRGPR